MAYYKCPNCKKVFSVNIFVDPVPLSSEHYPPMPYPVCGHLSRGCSAIEYLFGKKEKKQ